MALQGFFDDSGNEPTSPIFVLAGFITTNQQWAAFSDEWQLALDEPPRLKYFKMAEAEHFRGQFSKTKGWINENRDARLLTLISVLRVRSFRNDTCEIVSDVQGSIGADAIYFGKTSEEIRPRRRMKPSIFSVVISIASRIAIRRESSSA